MPLDFDFVRRKNPKVKRNLPVIYGGQRTVIRATSGDGLVLKRREVIHANDDHLICETSEELETAVRLMVNVLNSISEEDIEAINADLDNDKVLAFIRMYKNNAIYSVNWLKKGRK